MPVDVVIFENFAEVRLNWPSVRNALGPQEARELRLAVSEVLHPDRAPNAIVISASGPTFCSGGNLKVISELARERPEAVADAVYGEFQGLFRQLYETPAIVIAAVDGPAIGLGCDLAMSADVTFYGPKSWLAQGWMFAGLIPATGGIHALMRRAGPQAVWQLLLRERIAPAEAESLGLGSAVENARVAALDAARTFAAMPKEPLRAMRSLTRICDFDAHLKAALQYQVGFLTSDEFQKRAAEIMTSDRKAPVPAPNP